MKKLISLIIILSMIFSTYLVAGAAANITVKVNNQVVDFKGSNPYKSVTGIMVPLTEAANAIGAKVEYKSATKEAEVSFGGTIILFKGSRLAALINGKVFNMPQEAIIRSGKTYVPVRFFYEKLGGSVGWDPKTNCVVVNIKLPTENSSTPIPKLSDSINVSMPASADFKPNLTTLSPIDPDTLKELQAYKDNKDGKLYYVRPNGEGVNYYMNNAKVIEEVGLGLVTKECIISKSMMEAENNVDYRTIGSDYIQQYRYYFMPGSGLKFDVYGGRYDIETLIKLRYDTVKKYKIVQKAEFLTDISLFYCDKNGENRTRGRLKFMFESVDPQYFKDYKLPNYELNKWYYADVEINLLMFFTQDEKWPHADLQYSNRAYLTQNILPY